MESYNLRRLAKDLMQLVSWADRNAFEANSLKNCIFRSFFKAVLNYRKIRATSTIFNPRKLRILTTSR